jgi:peptidyl-tRNA hydrolase, PTH1 family
MPYIFVGLGNPGEEYKDTRHNTGRMILEWLGESFKADWKEDRKLKVKSAKVKIGKQSVILLLPDTFMNNSGKAVRPFVENQKQTEKIVVIYDDLDLPFGKVKISFNKSSGGHKGLESVIKALKTEKFPRIRVGISPVTPTGKMKKPSGEEAVTKVIMGKYKEEEIKTLKKISKKINEILETFVLDGLEKAMTEFNR